MTLNTLTRNAQRAAVVCALSISFAFLLSSVPPSANARTQDSKAAGGEDRGVFRPSEVEARAVILSKPEPGYTEEAHQNYVTGVVKIRAVLAADGRVRNIAVVRGLPDGLTELCVRAARRIRFKPAVKDGHAVSQYVTLEYHFR